MTAETNVDPLACLGAPHRDSYTADWSVAVWPHADGWICDCENGGDVEIVSLDDEGTITTLWSGHVSNLPERVK